MNLIVCVDERGGMTFGGRRQSRDRAVCADIAANAVQGRLLMAEYSGPLFEGIYDGAVCRDDFLDIAEASDICFVENRALLPYIDKAESITLYLWNRHYPSDMSLDISPKAEGFVLFEVKEFEGYSHEKITKEIYRR